MGAVTICRNAEIYDCSLTLTLNLSKASKILLASKLNRLTTAPAPFPYSLPPVLAVSTTRANDTASGFSGLSGIS